MDEMEKLRQEIEELKKENAKLKETLETLETIENINRSNEIGKYIQQCKRALMIANLMNTVSVKNPLNEKQLKDEVKQATTEKSSLDKKIEEALDRAVYESAMVSESEYQYKDVLGGIEIQSISINGEKKDVYVIPPAIHGKTVVGIADKAFQDKEIHEIRLPNTLKYIEKEAFWGCWRLEKVDLPNSLEILGNYCFFRTGLRKITIPGGVKRIPHMCFGDCGLLNEVVLEDGIECIGASAFGGRTHISELVVPQSVKKVESGWGGKTIYSGNFDKIEHPKDVTVESLEQKHKKDEITQKRKSAKEKEDAEREARANYWKAYFASRYH